MKVIFVSHICVARKITNAYKEIIFSLNPTCSYILGTRKIIYLDFANIYEHELEWKKYFLYNSIVEKIVLKLNEIFFNYNLDYKKKNWLIFNDFSYVIKIWYDTLLFHSKILHYIVTKFNPSILEFPNYTNIKIDNDFLIDDNTSIIEKLARENLKIKIHYYLINNEDILIQSKFTFGQPNFYFKIPRIKQKLKNIFQYLKIYYLLKFKKIKHLGIGCDEINYIHDNNRIINFEYLSVTKNNKLSKQFILEIYKILNSHKFFKFKNIKFLFFFIKLIESIYLKTEFYLKEYKYLNKLINKNNLKTFVFQTMSPFYYPVFIFRKIAQEKKIRIINWVHGGYFTYSNPGYDVVDYKFSHNHIGYGKYLIKLLKNKKININLINKKKFNVDYVGSFKFDDLHYKNYHSYNKKKKITFFIGCQMNMNQFYYGYNRKNACTSIWREQVDIIKILYRFSNKYEIIIKDYPSGSKHLWKNIIKTEFKNNITYVSGEKNIVEIFKESDLNIFPWVSTTFFESLYYDADVFLYDEDLYEGPFINKFNKELVWSKNIMYFKRKLLNYLIKGKFYKTDKSILRDYFINYNMDNESKRKRFFSIIDNLKQ